MLWVQNTLGTIAHIAWRRFNGTLSARTAGAAITGRLRGMAMDIVVMDRRQAMVMAAVMVTGAVTAMGHRAIIQLYGEAPTEQT
jgi:hypothetical protein